MTHAERLQQDEDYRAGYAAGLNGQTSLGFSVDSWPWREGWQAGGKRRFLLATVQMLWRRGYTREQIEQAVVEVDLCQVNGGSLYMFKEVPNENPSQS